MLLSVEIMFIFGSFAPAKTLVGRSQVDQDIKPFWIKLNYWEFDTRVTIFEAQWGIKVIFAVFDVP